MMPNFEKIYKKSNNKQKIHSFSNYIFNDLSILGRIHTYSSLFSDFHDDIEKFHDMFKNSMIFP